MKRIIRIPEEGEIPLIGLVHIGIIDRGTNMLQIRPITTCPLNCIFCSTDAGNKSKYRISEYYVSLDYLIEKLKEILKVKGEAYAFIDSVGDPLTYPHLVDLVQGINELSKITGVAVETNGFLLNERIVDKLVEAGLDRINISIHSLDEKLSKYLTGCNEYDVQRIVEIIKYVNESKLELTLTPVWIPSINDKEIERIIELAKKINRNERYPILGIQKYEVHKYGRKIKGIKEITWYKFYKKLGEWEKKFGLKLKLGPKDFGIKKTKSLPKTMRVGEKVRVEVKLEGWMKDQMIGVARGRSITLVNCKARVGEKIKVRILRNKDNIYVAR